MLFQQEFANFRAAAEATLYDSTKSRGGFATVDAADDALRVLEDHMNVLERALVDIHRAITDARPSR